MFAFFKKRAVLVTLGLLLLALFVWFAGPYFAFADYHPLAPVWARIAVIAIILGIYFGSILLKKLNAIRASAKLVNAMAKQQPAVAGNADVQQLRERFEEATAALNQDRGKGQSLYELPWYVIIGSPGSGKTTALMNSGLNFPLAQRFGKEALRGVGGTRNCDWWFTDEAVLLDTAGRYTTQDSDQSADSAGWREFLGLLTKYRKRRPLNGVIVAISVSDLIAESQAQRETHVAAVKRRLDELNRELKVQLPVYLMVTKCDLVAGFTEYFDDLTQEGRSQVWGVTFPYELTTSGQASVAYPAEFDALMTRLNERVFARVEEERDVRRRAAIFGFPQQLAAVRDALAQFVNEVFSATRFDGKTLLRGVYFTSGTQEGTPIDRLLGSIGRSFAMSSASVNTSGRGKAYFIERLLKDVMFAESGLAGVNRRYEVKKAALQLGAYAAMTLIAVLGVIAFSISYGRNKAYVAEVNQAIGKLAATPEVSNSAGAEQLLPRLDAVRTVVEAANRYRDDTPVLMRWGLYQGSAIGNAARDAYLRELDGELLPHVGETIRARLIAYTAEPDKLYEYLKAYLMLGEPEHLDKTQLAFMVDLEWQRAYADQAATRERLTQHLHRLLDDQDKLRPLNIDQQLIQQARTAIKQASVAQLMYSRLKLQYIGDTSKALHLDNELGLGAQTVLKRKSGKPLSEPITGLYTPAVFNEVSGLGTLELVQQFAGDQWVLGDDSVALSNSGKTINEVMALYEQDYIRTWDAILNDVSVASFQGIPELTNGLAILAGPTSPLRALLVTIDKNTYLVKPAEEAGKAGVIDKAQQAIQDRLSKLLSSTSQAAGQGAINKPGAQVTAHFAQIHQLVAGAPGQAPIDRVLAQMGQMQQKLQSVGSGVGETNALKALTQSGSSDVLKSLQQEAATLPPVIAALVTQVSGKSEAVTMGQARNELVNLYNTDVVKECSSIVKGRYPFEAKSSLDVPLADFGRLFGAGGVFDNFFKEHLQALVDTSRTPWSWREGATSSLGVSSGILRQFEQAQRIRDTYFRPGGQLPEVRFNVTATDLDATASRSLLEIDGQNVEYRHGPERTQSATWPGPSPGAAAISFEDRNGGKPNQVFQGPWALFRLLDAANLQQQSDVRYQATWAAGSHEARYTLEATSIRNPFANAVLKQFHCGA